MRQLHTPLLLTGLAVMGGCLFFPPYALTAVPQQPACTAPAQDTPVSRQRVSLQRYLEDVAASGQMLSGQNMGHADLEDPTVLDGRVFAATGAHVAVFGVDLGFQNTVEDDARVAQLVAAAHAHWNAGGLVTLSMTPANPFNNGSAWNRGMVEPGLLFVPGPARNHWEKTLGNVARVLRQLQDRGVVVLWRPLHEMNGAWFWWGGWSPDNYVNLWKHMHHRFTVDEGLHNLLWVYAPNRKGDAESPVDRHWPGADCADLAGLDAYTDDVTAMAGSPDWTALRALGRPVALTEVGPSSAKDGSWDAARLATVRDQLPLAWFLTWQSWTDSALKGSGENRMSLDVLTNATTLLQDSRVITREQVTWTRP